MRDTKEQMAVMENPYVEQIEKFAASLQKLSGIFLSLEGTKETFAPEEVEQMLDQVHRKVCASCEEYEICMKERQKEMRQFIYDLLLTIENYGADLNIEMKRKLEKRCCASEELLEELLEAFGSAKQELLWNNRIVQNRQGCAKQMDLFTEVVRQAAKEIGASIFRDEHLEKKLRNRFRKSGIRLLQSLFFVTENGRYEIHVTIKAMKHQCITTKEVARIVSSCTGKHLILQADERPILPEEYCTVVCMESASFYSLRGVAKIGKGCDKISGDNFLMMELPGGKEGAAISDGMGSGEKAFRESARVVELLEELLEAGYPHKMALQLMNTALVAGREEICFSTIDMSIFDMYSGVCEFIKVGASTTFLKCGREVERITSTSLPLGVVQNLEFDTVTRQLESGDVVVMVTDGVMDALPVGEQELVLETIIKGTEIQNPTEMAEHILEQVLNFTGEKPLDDMTVLVIGIWNA